MQNKKNNLQVCHLGLPGNNLQSMANERLKVT